MAASVRFEGHGDPPLRRTNTTLMPTTAAISSNGSFSGSPSQNGNAAPGNNGGAVTIARHHLMQAPAIINAALQSLRIVDEASPTGLAQESVHAALLEALERAHHGAAAHDDGGGGARAPGSGGGGGDEDDTGAGFAAAIRVLRSMQLQPAEGLAAPPSSKGARAVQFSVPPSLASSDVFLPLRDAFTPSHSDTVTSICVDHLNGRVYTGSFDDTAAVWVAGSRERVATLPHADWVNCVAAAHVVSLLSDAPAPLALLPPSSQQQQQQHQQLAAAQPSGGEGFITLTLQSYIVTGSEDGSVTFWRCDGRGGGGVGAKHATSNETYHVAHQLQLPGGGPALHIAVAESDATGRSGGGGSGSEWWTEVVDAVDSGDGIADGIRCATPEVAAALPFATSDILLCASLRLLFLVSCTTGAILREFREERADITSIAIAPLPTAPAVRANASAASPSSSAAAAVAFFVGRSDGRISCWDAAAGLVIRELVGPAAGKPIRSLVFPPVLATAGSPMGSQHRHSPQQHFRPRPLAVDAGSLVSGADDGSVRIWSLDTGACHRVIDAHRAAVRSMSFHLRGAQDCELFLFTSSNDGSIACHALRNRRSGVVHATTGAATAVAVYDDPATVGSAPLLLSGEHSGLFQALPILNPEITVLSGACV